LNAPVIWSYLWRTAQHAKDEALRMFSEYVVTIPIASGAAAQRQQTALAVAQLTKLTQAMQQAKAQVLDVLRLEYEVEKPGQALTDFAALGSDAFLLKVKKRRRQGGKPLTPATLSALRQLYQAEFPSLLQQQAQVLAHEQTITSQVHAAYQLTPDELLLLRESQPPRMPPGW
jgi:hypothetical protein